MKSEVSKSEVILIKGVDTLIQKPSVSLNKALDLIILVKPCNHHLSRILVHY